MKNIIPYGKQSISQKDIDEVVKVLKSDFLTQGPKISEFEEKIRLYVGAKYCVVLNSGTAALHSAYYACGLNNNDQLVTSPMTFAATSNAALYQGGEVKFVDINSSGNIDVNCIEKKITKKTKIISPIHFGGNPVDLKSINKLAKKYNLKIVEDACHALGASYMGKKIGSCEYSDAVVFSFHPVKHITTGEGGAVTTNNLEIYKKLLLFRSHGITKNEADFKNANDGPWYHEMQDLGFNYRITDLQAALGISQLKRLDGFINKRTKIAQYYDDAFKSNPYFSIPQKNKDCVNSYHLYPILLNEKYYSFKKEIFNKLKDKNIFVQVHYIPVYFHPYYQALGYKKGACPNAEEFYKSEISLPMYYDLTQTQQKYVISSLMQILKELI